MCISLNIEKRRSSAYHSRGNGFAERNILKMREVLRTVLLDKRLPQKNWRQVIPGIAFALNASKSPQSNYSPFEVMFGRRPLFPQDLLLDTFETGSISACTTKAYVEELKLKLKLIVQKVSEELNLNAKQMRIKYNKKLNYTPFSPDEKVWLTAKYFKAGESGKCAPRRNDPWTIIEKLGNGVNYAIRNDSTKQFKIVHHDRLRHANLQSLENPKSPEKPKSTACPEKPADSFDFIDDSDDEDVSDADDVPVNEDVRYNLRNRVPRRIPGAIPWDAVDLD